MSNTQNYGFNKHLEVLETVDRELKRIEDKTDQNATAIKTKVDKVDGHSLIPTHKLEQIADNKNHIECLSKRIDRADSDIADRYTKAEVDAKLECKASKCELEKHIIDPHAHQELFDQKVNKKEGYELIPSGDLAQISTNKNDIAALDNRVTTNEANLTKTYTQEEVDSLLANKANKTLQWHDLPLRNGFKAVSRAQYSKDDSGIVRLRGYILTSNSGPVLADAFFADLPVGFRSKDGFSCSVAGTNTTDTTYTDSVTLIVRSNGSIQMGKPLYVSNFNGSGIHLDGIDFSTD